MLFGHFWPTYLVPLYIVPFLMLSWTPLPTLILDVINERSQVEFFSNFLAFSQYLNFTTKRFCNCLVKSLVKLTCYNFFRCAICVLTTLEPIWPWLDQTSEYICANSGKIWKFSTTIQVNFLIGLFGSIKYCIRNWKLKHFPQVRVMF